MKQLSIKKWPMLTTIRKNPHQTFTHLEFDFTRLM